MPQTRISADVWRIAEELAEARGLGSARAAIEAVFRVHWQDYMGGSLPQPSLPPEQPEPQPSLPPEQPVTAQEGLENLLSIL